MEGTVSMPEYDEHAVFSPIIFLTDPSTFSRETCTPVDLSILDQPLSGVCEEDLVAGDALLSALFEQPSFEQPSFEQPSSPSLFAFCRTQSFSHTPSPTPACGFQPVAKRVKKSEGI
jgi:hypothetical protein